MQSSTITLIATALLLPAAPFGPQDSGGSSFTGVEAARDMANPNANLPFRGSIRCIGPNNPAPNDQLWPPYCPTDTWTSIKGRVLTMRWATTDPNTTGLLTYYIHLNVDTNTYTGPWWGAFVLQVPGKGDWEGTFTCESTGVRPDGVGGQAVCRLLANGDGAFQQCHLMAEVTYGGFFVKPATVVGRYLRRDTPAAPTASVLPLPQAQPMPLPAATSR